MFVNAFNSSFLEFSYLLLIYDGALTSVFVTGISRFSNVAGCIPAVVRYSLTLQQLPADALELNPLLTCSAQCESCLIVIESGGNLMSR